MDPREDEKRAAAEAAAGEVSDGMAVGLGTGSTVAHFLPSLAARGLADLRCVATSEATESQARVVGLPVQPFDLLDRLDIAVDGADQVSPDLWLVKGGGGAHGREKVVAAAAERFVVIVSSDKLVPAIEPPVPLEVLSFGFAATLRQLRALGPVEVRDAPPTADGNTLVDYRGEVTDPAALAGALDAIPGVIHHGLFPPEVVDVVLVGRPGGSVDRVPTLR
ncbi:MAG: ribose-5-phosphate isomerase RpiA [Actinomycetota bacterium]